MSELAEIDVTDVERILSEEQEPTQKPVSEESALSEYVPVIESLPPELTEQEQEGGCCISTAIQ